MKAIFAYLSVLSVLGMQTAAACEGCRAPGISSEHQTVMAGIGFSWSIIFMLAFVFSILIGMSWFIAQTCRAVDRRNQSNR